MISEGGRYFCCGFGGGFQSIIKNSSPSPITFQKQYIKLYGLQPPTNYTQENNKNKMIKTGKESNEYFKL